MMCVKLYKFIACSLSAYFLSETNLHSKKYNNHYNTFVSILNELTDVLVNFEKIRKEFSKIMINSTSFSGMSL